MKQARRWATSRWAGRLIFLLVLLATMAIALQMRDAVERRWLDHAVSQQGVRVVDQIDQVFDTVARMLAEADRSTRADCSAEELRRLRAVFMRAKFTKDLGRYVEGNLACTAVLGVLAKPVVPRQEPLVLGAGLTGYWTALSLTDQDSFALVVRTEKSSVHVDFDAFRVMRSPGLYYVVGLRDRATRLVIGLDAQHLPGFVEAGKGQGREDRRFCSRRFPICATILVTAVADERARTSALWTVLILGGLLGTCLGWLALAAHRRWSALPARMRRALAAGRFALRYQPIVALETPPRIVSAEALIRWIDGPASPEVFIAEAERTGMIAEITAFVVRTVLDENRELFEAFPDFRVTINVSSPELVDGSLMETLDFHWPPGLPRRHIGFELTERSTAELQDILPELERLRWLGHPIYMDDFGSGYSSLSQLQHLPIDYIKVDRSLLPEATAQLQGSILPEILAIARRLQAGLVFEGVETGEQARMLEYPDQIVLAQGWYFGRPDTVEVLTRLMTPDISGAA